MAVLCSFTMKKQGSSSRIKERMLMEVAKSIEIAYELCNLFTVYDVDMEVHADINTNPHFKSNDALKEAMGYILGMGFAFKAKPEAFASSSCANKSRELELRASGNLVLLFTQCSEF